MIANRYPMTVGAQDGTTITEVLLPENLVDMGPRKFAEGEVGFDDQGRVATYTVAAGDVLDVIGKPFCTYDGGLLATLNGKKAMSRFSPARCLCSTQRLFPVSSTTTLTTDLAVHCQSRNLAF